jgi:uncharacterized protein (DUF3084 family)
LIAEALGDLAQLLDRLEAVGPTLDASRQALLAASNALARQAPLLEDHHNAATQKATAAAVRHIERRTSEFTRTTIEAQRKVMETAAKDLFIEHLNPQLRLLVEPLREMRERLKHPAVSLLVYGTAVIMGAALTEVVEVWLRLHRGC